MERPITSFNTDDNGDWFAVLACGHTQHMRHKPPFSNRLWVLTEEGRSGKIGRVLNCLRCEPPQELVR